MDQRNKLTQTYMPDKKTQGETFLVGLSGGIKSMVAASLLKIQKHDLIAVTVLTGLDSSEIDSSKVLSCHLTEAKKEAIQAFCRQLGIPHHFVNVMPEFKDQIVDGWVASRISGTYPQPCQSCHHLRLQTLFQKMKHFGAKKLVTGHLAKLYQQEHTGMAYVHTSNDEESDQSGIVSTLPHEILSSLILPLSDLQKKEVLKLAENFGLNPEGPSLGFEECFKPDDSLMDYLKSQAPPSLVKRGDVSSLDQEKNFGDHEGVLNHSYAEIFKTDDPKEKHFFVEFNHTDRKIKLDHESYFMRDKVLLVNCIVSEETQLNAPLKGVIESHDGEFLDCWIHPKTLNAAFIEMDAPGKFIKGEISTVYRKKGKNSKIYLSGKVSYLPTKPAEEEDKNVKLDYRSNW